MKKPLRTVADFQDEIARLERDANFAERTLLAGSIALDYVAVTNLKQQIHEQRTKANQLRRRFESKFSEPFMARKEGA